MTSNPMTLKAAAERVLRERGPMHSRDLASAIIEEGLAETEAGSPASSVNAILAGDIKRKGSESVFIRTEPGVFGIRGLHSAALHVQKVATSDASDTKAELHATEGAWDDSERRVRVSHYPHYRKLRHLLRIWPGHRRSQIMGLQTTISRLRGTPQQTVDWSEPSKWIPERLEGEDRELAEAIWTRSKGVVNPRHTDGAWRIAQGYELIREDAHGILALSDAGRNFLEHIGGAEEASLDEAEGLIKLLSIVADNGPASQSELLEDWTDYLNRRSRFASDSTRQQTLTYRLSNLRDRGLIERKGRLYSISEEGVAYLSRVDEEESAGGGDHHELRKLARQKELETREALLAHLLEMDPYAFEHLIRRLLEKMDYQNVEVTTRSGDGGVDVVADIELGITSVREVVQVKRHRRAIQRKDLDALRGSLYRFNAVRGTIVTTARFSRGTSDAAFALGAAPITLIDGEKLLDLLIEQGIGVRKRTIELLELNHEDLEQNDETDLAE